MPLNRALDLLTAIFMASILFWSQYKIFNLKLSVICLLMIFGLGLLRHNFKLSVPREHIYFTFFIVIYVMSSGLFDVGFYGTFNLYIVGVFLVIASLALPGTITPGVFFSASRFFSIFITSLLLLQVWSTIATGAKAGGILIFPEFVSRPEIWQQDPRPSSIFSEPQLYCTVVLPCFFRSVLFGYTKTAFFLAVGIVLSQSIYGIGLLIALSLYVFVTSPSRIGGIGVISSLAVLIGFIFSLSQLDYSSLVPLFELFAFDLRGLTGWGLVQEMKINELITGYLGTYDDFVLARGMNVGLISVYYYAGNDLFLYLPTLWSVLINFGLFGVFLFLNTVAKPFCHGDRFLRGLVLLFIGHAFTATSFFNEYYSYFFFYILVASREYSCNVRNSRV